MKLPPSAGLASAANDDAADRAADYAALPAFLRDRPRQVPFAEPPAGYFEALPVRVLTRIRAEEAALAPTTRAGFGQRFGHLAENLVEQITDLSRLRWPRLRVAFASAALSAAFVGAFWLGQIASVRSASAVSADRALATVGTAELVEYLADPTTVRLTAADLAALSTTDAPTDAALLAIPRADLDDAIDELPFDETYL